MKSPSSREIQLACSISFLSLALLSGCGDSSPMPEEPPDLEAEYALETKHKVLKFVETYRANPQRARDVFPDFAESVMVWEEQPTGEYEETYDQIAQIVKDLQANYDQPAKVDQLETLAKKLPGDVEAYRKELAELEN